MVANVAERWGKLQGWFVVADKRRLSWRTTEWLLALAGPITAYNMVFNRYGWKSPYYSQWGESWFALVLLIPMVAPVLLRLFSGTGLDLQKRIALAAPLLFGLALAIKFRPQFGGASFMGFFVPMALYALAGFLWFAWRNKKFLTLTTSRKRPAAQTQP